MADVRSLRLEAQKARLTANGRRNAVQSELLRAMQYSQSRNFGGAKVAQSMAVNHESEAVIYEQKAALLEQRAIQLESEALKIYQQLSELQGQNVSSPEQAQKMKELELRCQQVLGQQYR